MQVITYSENGSPRVVYPAPEYPGTIDDLAALVVPPGLPWQAVDHTELPAPDPAELLAAQSAWDEAIEFRRTSPTIAALAVALGMTETDIDTLFRAAMTIEA
jgi:hypothetical protein